jgi:hypothetical protein
LVADAEAFVERRLGGARFGQAQFGQAGQRFAQPVLLDRVAAAVREAPAVALAGDDQGLALAGDFDPGGLLQLRREARKHQRARGERGRACGRAGRADEQRQREHQHGDDGQDDGRARLHASVSLVTAGLRQRRPRARRRGGDGG